MKKLTALSEKLKDERSREVIFVSHCLLNTNTRYLGGAFRRGLVGEIVRESQEKGVGIVQMKCPEQSAWGGVLKRWMWAAYGLKSPLDAVFRAFLPIFVLYTRFAYGRIASSVAAEIGDYVRSGFSVKGVVGVDGSPSCGLDIRLNIKKSFALFSKGRLETLTREDFNRSLYETCAEGGSGIFFEKLKKQLKKRNLDIPLYAHSLIAEMNGETSHIEF
jgi:predicted secreted protein